MFLLFSLLFSHNLKNCSRWMMRDTKPTIDKDKILPIPKDTFLRHLDSMIKKNKLFYSTLAQSGYINTHAKMYRRDSTKNSRLKQKLLTLLSPHRHMLLHTNMLTFISFRCFGLVMIQNISKNGITSVMVL